jgi:dimethyladenosine transferase 1
MSRLPPLPSLKELIRLYGLQAKQQLSQNFIMDLQLAGKFARTAGPLKGKTVIEVGCGDKKRKKKKKEKDIVLTTRGDLGPGSITRALLQEDTGYVVGVEKDERFQPILKTLEQATRFPDPRFNIVYGDMTVIKEDELIRSIVSPLGPESVNEKEEKVDLWEMSANESPVRIVGNLPFGVATELLLKWLRLLHKREGIFSGEWGRVPLVLAFQTEVADRITAPINCKVFFFFFVVVVSCSDLDIIVWIILL